MLFHFILIAIKPQPRTGFLFNQLSGNEKILLIFFSFPIFFNGKEVTCRMQYGLFIGHILKFLLHETNVYIEEFVVRK